MSTNSDKIPRSSPSTSPTNGNTPKKAEDVRKTETTPTPDAKDSAEDKNNAMPVPQVKVSLYASGSNVKVSFLRKQQQLQMPKPVPEPVLVLRTKTMPCQFRESRLVEHCECAASQQDFSVRKVA